MLLAVGYNLVSPKMKHGAFRLTQGMKVNGRPKMLYVDGQAIPVTSWRSLYTELLLRLDPAALESYMKTSGTKW